MPGTQSQLELLVKKYEKTIETLDSVRAEGEQYVLLTLDDLKLMIKTIKEVLICE